MSKKHEHGNHFEGKRGLSVEVRDNNIEAALKILKKKVMQEGLIRDLRRHEYYEKPGDRRRRDEAKAKKRYEKKGTPSRRPARNNDRVNQNGGQYNGSVNLP